MVIKRKSSTKEWARNNKINDQILDFIFKTLVITLLVSQGAGADITVDGSLGGPAELLDGPNYVIPASLGQQSGNNLFHSFGEFNIAAKESATFTANGATGPINNVLSRVTGGDPSSINGSLNSIIPGADFYFINPAGVTFGPSANLNVPASFHVSTADYLRLGENGQFAASVAPDQSILVSMPPSAFGFLDGTAPASIRFEGSGSVEAELASQLLGTEFHGTAVADGKMFSVVGGDLYFGSGDFFGLTVGSRLLASSGQINLASVVSAGEVSRQDNGGFQPAPAQALGKINITPGSRVSASGNQGGTVFIRGGALTVESAFIAAATTGSGSGGNISIKVNELHLSNGGQILGASFATGDAGTLDIEAEQSITITGPSSGLFSTAQFSGENGGNAAALKVATPTLTLSNGGTIDSGTYGSGNGATTTIVTDRISATTGARITVATEGTGDAGNLQITAAEAVLISGRADINPRVSRSGLYSTSSQFSGNPAGNAGDIFISSANITVQDGGRIKADSLSQSLGKSGGIEIQTTQLTLAGGGQISNSNGGSGLSRGGNVTIDSSSSISITGLDETDPAQFRSGIFTDTLANADSGAIELSTHTLIVDGGRITSDSTNVGKAGDITLTAETIELRNEAQLFSGTAGAGDGGTITIIAHQALVITGTGEQPDKQVTGIFSNVKDQGTGQGGGIEIQASAFSISKGGEISSETRGQGGAGDINITVASKALLDHSRIKTTVAHPQGNSGAAFSEATTGGDISITAGQIELTNSSEILSSSLRGPGNAGDILLRSHGYFLSKGSTVSTKAVAAAGGDIAIHSRSIQLTRESTISASVTQGPGGGGNLSLNAKTIAAIEKSALEAKADQGFGGNITINSDVFLKSANSALDASSNVLGNEGSVVVNAPDTDISGSISTLPVSFFDAPQLLSDHCTRRIAEDMSSFTVVGETATPVFVNSPLQASYAFEHEEVSAKPLDYPDNLYTPPTPVAIPNDTCEKRAAY